MERFSRTKPAPLSAILAILAILATSCGGDDNSNIIWSTSTNYHNGPGSGMIWDFTNYDIVVEVRSAANGENLLDPDVEGNILHQDIAITYDGEIFRPNQPQTRENPPIWEGLRIGKPYYWQTESPHALFFGEFAPGRYHDEKFTIDWGDGSTTRVAFDLYITWHKTEPTVHRALRIDGEEQNQFALKGTVWK